MKHLLLVGTVVITALLLAPSLSACTLAPKKLGPPTLTFTAAAEPDLALVARNYPKTNGSISARPLQILMACKIFGAPCRWYKSGGHTWSTLSFEYGLEYGKTSPEQESMFSALRERHYGSNQSYKDLINGKADFILRGLCRGTQGHAPRQHRRYAPRLAFHSRRQGRHRRKWIRPDAVIVLHLSPHCHTFDTCLC